MQDTTTAGGLYNLVVVAVDNSDEKQQFVFEGGKIYCNAKNAMDTVLYMLQYSGDTVGCGLAHEGPEEEMAFVPDKVNAHLQWLIHILQFGALSKFADLIFFM